MIIYSDLNEFRKIYTYHVKKGLEENDEIVVISSAYETPDRVRDNLEGVGVDVRKHISVGALRIIDAMKAYHLSDVYGLLKLLESLQARADKEGKSGLLCFGDVGTFFLLNKARELTDYESTIPKKVQLKTKGFCCYHKKNFDALTKEQKQNLYECHLRVL